MSKDDVKTEIIPGSLPLRPYLDDIWAAITGITTDISTIETEIDTIESTCCGEGGGGGGADQNLFSSIIVDTQDTITADSITTALTFVSGTNMTITTNNATKEITFTSTGGGSGGSPNLDGGFADTVYYATTVDGGGA